jgi:hypothetical protein
MHRTIPALKQAGCYAEAPIPVLSLPWSSYEVSHHQPPCKPRCCRSKSQQRTREPHQPHSPAAAPTCCCSCSCFCFVTRLYHGHAPIPCCHGPCLACTKEHNTEQRSTVNVIALQNNDNNSPAPAVTAPASPAEHNTAERSTVSSTTCIRNLPANNFQALTSLRQTDALLQIHTCSVPPAVVSAPVPISAAAPGPVPATAATVPPHRPATAIVPPAPISPSRTPAPAAAAPAAAALPPACCCCTCGPRSLLLLLPRWRPTLWFGCTLACCCCCCCCLVAASRGLILRLPRCCCCPCLLLLL